MLELKNRRQIETTKPAYERLWGEHLAYAQQLIDGGEREFARLCTQLRGFGDQAEPFDDGLGIVYQANNVPRDQRGVPLLQLAAVGGKYQLLPRGLVDDIIVNTVLTQVDDATDAVVELGSGYGRNIFDCYARCVQPGPRFIAGELTDAGRATTALVAGLAKQRRIQAHPFNYYDPDFSFLPDRPNLVVFTSHSIEQITTIGTAVFERLMACCERLTVLHWEPVGWQRDKRLLALAERCHVDGKRPNWIPNADNAAFVANAFNWSLRHAYNIDLLPSLDRLQRSGAIEIQRVQYDVFGSNPWNPSTLIVWNKAVAGDRPA